MQSTFQSAGKSIRLDSFLPESPGPHPAILILHGSGGNTGFWLDRIAPFVSRLSLTVFAVHYFDATSTLRAQPAQLFDGFHVPAWLQTLRDTLTHLRTRPTVDPNRIALVGISLGGFLALALGTEAALNLRALVDISGGFAEPWNTRVTPRFPPTLILHGDADTVVPVSNAHTASQLLTQHRVPHQTRILPGEGHWFSSGAQLQILGATAQFLGQYLK
jgi:carboxymethylenebutenolidase